MSKVKRLRPKKKSKAITLPKLTEKAQKVFNAWIRERDKYKGCISCGGKVEQAGHFYSQGHHSALRFNEINTNGQCVRCNHFLSGNLNQYRVNLIKRVGEQAVLLLDSQARKPKKWTRFELEQIIEHYKLESCSR